MERSQPMPRRLPGTGGGAEGAPARPPRARARCVPLLAVLALALCLAPAAGARSPAEYELKAAFLYKFLKFVEWPPGAFADAGTPIRVCVLGDDPFDGALAETLRGRSAHDRPLELHRTGRASDTEGCHVVFVSASERGRLDSVLEALGGHALTVGDTRDYGRRGVMINLRLEDQRIRFEVNMDSAERAGLRISSQLLRLAQVVRGEAGEGE